MKLRHDSEVNAVYIYLVGEELIDTSGIVDHTQELTDEVNIDWMKDGTLFGIEILCVESEPTLELTTESLIKGGK